MSRIHDHGQQEVFQILQLYLPIKSTFCSSDPKIGILLTKLNRSSIGLFALIESTSSLACPWPEPESKETITVTINQKETILPGPWGTV